MSGYRELRSIRSARRRSRGFSLIETAMALGITAATLAGFAQLQSDTTQRAKAYAVSDRMQQIAQASQSYVTAYGTQLIADIPVGGSAIIPVAKVTPAGPEPGGPFGLPGVQSGGFLPSSFVDTNAYAQSTVLIVNHVPASGTSPAHLEALTTTVGGQTMTDSMLGAALTKLGAMGGVVMASPPPGVAANTIQGAFGGWAQPTTSWASTPSVGHLQANLSFTGQGNFLSDYLDRYNTGNPEANRMHTNIDANTNGIDRLTNLDTQTIDNTRGALVQVNSQLGVQNGGTACTGGVAGCGWQISGDGGFVNNNTGWISFVGNISAGGLELSGVGNNLKVGGNTETVGNDTVDGALTVVQDATFSKDTVTVGNALVEGTQTVDNNQVTYGDSLTYGRTVAGDYSGILSPATECGGACGSTVYGGISLQSDWLRIHGSNGVQWSDFGGGLYMQDANWVRTYNGVGMLSDGGFYTTADSTANRFVDVNNASYYLVPSGNSNLQNVNAFSVSADAISLNANWSTINNPGGLSNGPAVFTAIPAPVCNPYSGYCVGGSLTAVHANGNMDATGDICSASGCMANFNARLAALGG